MTFWQEIRKLREDGLIPMVWSRDDLRPHLADKFSPNTINTVPSNASATHDLREQGDYVQRGMAPKAWRVAPGRFQLVDDPEVVVVPEPLAKPVQAFTLQHVAEVETGAAGQVLAHLVSSQALSYQDEQGVLCSAAEWVKSWAAMYPSGRYPEEIYAATIAEPGRPPSEQQTILAGAWKDRALTECGGAAAGAIGPFDGRWYVLNGRFEDHAASAAAATWRLLAANQAEVDWVLGEFGPGQALNALADLKPGHGGLGASQPKRFGLPRAVVILHMRDPDRFPLFDSRTLRAANRLTGGAWATFRYPSAQAASAQSADWYLTAWRVLVRHIAREAGADLRTVDKALFSYGDKGLD